MTLEQLRIFVAVAEHEHMTRAAGTLNLTQSATSAAVAALEERYAIKLFDRVGRNIRLTDAGRRFLVEARAMLARAAAAEAVLADLAGLTRGTLTLAASQTVGNYWLPPLIHRYRQRYPGIDITLKIGNTEQVAAWVQEGVANLGFIEGEIENPGLSTAPIADDELALIVSASHPLAKCRTPTAAQLKATKWVVREQGSGTRHVLEATLKGLGVAPDEIDIALELPSNESVRAAVLAGAGATIMSRIVVEGLVHSRALIELTVPMPARRFSLLHHKEHHITRAEQELQKLITEKK
ncbi:transcriptional regulator of LysR family [Afipia carboxidovorans OM5]|uniref:Transcriptional regulator, LysR family n=1 Tax=Afipia carboxidovorans (strain ATCC 49405 / DSM 1227 / KCTC 32145 / OM5) TaxID=504832 RepID=B6JJQ7_AFIC5|nr:LysR family transcriptional regulator [Afipia carboxidovorans]ACI94651.1 transcriptional regulator of LysR family [Afipia carboxidovorans OM5]AEI01739.1 transcriptional regulator, LysR family [Afipia carboxidovorans OM4]AEI05314.1 transcriptional regulator, LysR family [Afipia carboxidovorans OM5]